MMPSSRIAIIGVKRGKGGIPRVLVNLIKGFSEHGYATDILCREPDQMDSRYLPAETRLLPIGDADTPISMWNLSSYLYEQNPFAIISNRERGRPGIIMAKRLAKSSVVVAFRVGNPVSVHLERRHGLKRFFRAFGIQLTYPRSDVIIANSEKLAEDIRKVVPNCSQRIQLLPNPVVHQHIEALAQKTVDHPWLPAKTIPVVIGAGRLSRQKDFKTLVEAVYLINQRSSCRLIIIGDGKELSNLEALARELGIGHNVDFPGFVDNPYSYFSKASLFVLSSAWEGCPNVLLEALAVGVPVVATDCLSGPREVLQNGRLGALVPVGQAEALARAIEKTIEAHPSSDVLRAGVRGFNLLESSGEYLRVLEMMRSSRVS